MFIATFAKKRRLAPEEQNVYSDVAVKVCLAPEERNVLVGCHTFRSSGARRNPFDPVFHKHFVPLEPWDEEVAQK